MKLSFGCKIEGRREKKRRKKVEMEGWGSA